MKIEWIKDLGSRHWLILAAVCAFAFLGVPKVRAQTSETVKLTTNDQLSGTPTFQGQTATTTTTTTTDPLYIYCTASETCTSSPINNLLVSSGLPSFTLDQNGSVTSGALNEYFAVVVPGNASVSFSVNGVSNVSAMTATITSSSNLFQALGLTYPSTFGSEAVPSLSLFNKLSGQVIGSQSLFTAYVFDVQSCSSCTSLPNITITITGTSLPLGTDFFAYLTDSSTSTNVVSDTSVDGTVTIVPEPNTVLLLGSGMLLLLGLAFVKRRSAVA